MASLLFIFRHSPYHHSLSKEGLDTALAAAALGQEVSILFMGDGALQLIKGQNSEAIGQKSREKALSALPLYGVNNLYIDNEALTSIGDTPLIDLPFQVVERERIKVLINQHQEVLAF